MIQVEKLLKRFRRQRRLVLQEVIDNYGDYPLDSFISQDLAVMFIRDMEEIVKKRNRRWNVGV